MIRLLRLFGALLTRLPRPALKAVAIISAEILFLSGRGRRRIVLANLRHAFPDRDDRWIVSTGRKSFRQMVEFGLLAAALPSFSEARFRKTFSLAAESAGFLRTKIAGGRPVVLLAPHLGPQESLTLLPFFLPEMPPIGGIYRPLNDPAMDTWIRESRERFGTKLFSRKEGLQSAIRMLRKNQWLGLLFDQNSGRHGALITFLDRPASATELPGILAARHQAEVVLLYAARRGFWQIELRAEPGPASGDKDEINLAVNRWLENLLREREDLLPSWLWAHNRWRHQRVPKLSLRKRKNLLEEQNRFLGRAEVPRREPLFIRLPDDPREVELLLPFLQEIRQSRPDVAVTVIGKKDLLPRLRDRNLCEQALPLPPIGPGYFRFFRRLRRSFPSLYLVFATSFRSDFEAWLTGAPQRFGIERSGKRRFFLNRPWQLPPELENAESARIWEAFLHANGLEPTESEPTI